MNLFRNCFYLKLTQAPIQFFYIIVFTLLILLSCADERYTEIIEIEHSLQPEIFNRQNSEPDLDAMLSSFDNFGSLNIMTYHGDFDVLVSLHHQQLMEYFEKKENLEKDSLHCSVFTFFDKDGGAYLGRNFDNKNTDVLVGLFIPDSGFASIGFVPLMNLGFDDSNPFNPDSAKHRQRLLYGPLFTTDGLNERGVAVTVASVGRQTVAADSTKAYKYMLHLKRNILDHAYDLKSAVEIASQFNVFDNGKHRLSHHLLIADSSGRSAVLEWHEGKMQVIRNKADWQIATNTEMYDVSDQDLCRSCGRYNSIYDMLSAAPDTFSWQYAMNALYSAKQKNNIYHFPSGPLNVSTQWSAVFELKERAVNVCLQSKYDKVYRFKLQSKEFYKSKTGRTLK